MFQRSIGGAVGHRHVTVCSHGAARPSGAHTRLVLAHSPSPEGQTSEPRPGQPCSGAAAGCRGRSAAALTRQAARRVSPLSGGDAVFPALRLILGAQLSEDPR